MHITTETITPQIATTWLESNTNNRNVNKLAVDQYASDMARGYWKLNGDPIRLGTNRLIDGQHRLMAVCKSGVSIESVVIRGLDNDVFNTIDAGRKRTAGDTFGLHGETNANALASALRVIDKYNQGRMWWTSSPSTQEIQALLLEHPSVRESVRFCGSFRIISPASAAALHYLFSSVSPVSADEFMEKIRDGRGMDMGEPEYHAREILLGHKQRGQKRPTPELMAIVVKAWNIRRDIDRSGVDLTPRAVVFRLRLHIVDRRIESFPVISD